MRVPPSHTIQISRDAHPSRHSQMTWHPLGSHSSLIKLYLVSLWVSEPLVVLGTLGESTNRGHGGLLAHRVCLGLHTPSAQL